MHYTDHAAWQLVGKKAEKVAKSASAKDAEGNSIKSVNGTKLSKSQKTKSRKRPNAKEGQREVRKTQTAEIVSKKMQAASVVQPSKGKVWACTSTGDDDIDRDEDFPALPQAAFPSQQQSRSTNVSPVISEDSVDSKAVSLTSSPTAGDLEAGVRKTLFPAESSGQKVPYQNVFYNSKDQASGEVETRSRVIDIAGVQIASNFTPENVIAAVESLRRNHIEQKIKPMRADPLVTHAQQVMVDSGVVSRESTISDELTFRNTLSIVQNAYWMHGVADAVVVAHSITHKFKTAFSEHDFLTACRRAFLTSQHALKMLLGSATTKDYIKQISSLRHTAIGAMNHASWIFHNVLVPLYGEAKHGNPKAPFMFPALQLLQMTAHFVSVFEEAFIMSEVGLQVFLKEEGFLAEKRQNQEKDKELCHSPHCHWDRRTLPLGAPIAPLSVSEVEKHLFLSETTDSSESGSASGSLPVTPPPALSDDAASTGSSELERFFAGVGNSSDSGSSSSKSDSCSIPKDIEEIEAQLHDVRFFESLTLTDDEKLVRNQFVHEIRVTFEAGAEGTMSKKDVLPKFTHVLPYGSAAEEVSTDIAAYSDIDILMQNPVDIENTMFGSRDTSHPLSRSELNILTDHVRRKGAEHAGFAVPKDVLLEVDSGVEYYWRDFWGADYECGDDSTSKKVLLLIKVASNLFQCVANLKSLDKNNFYISAWDIVVPRGAAPPMLQLNVVGGREHEKGFKHSRWKSTSTKSLTHGFKVDISVLFEKNESVPVTGTIFQAQAANYWLEDSTVRPNLLASSVNKFSSFSHVPELYRTIIRFLKMAFVRQGIYRSISGLILANLVLHFAGECLDAAKSLVRGNPSVVRENGTSGYLQNDILSLARLGNMLMQFREAGSVETSHSHGLIIAFVLRFIVYYAEVDLSTLVVDVLNKTGCGNSSESNITIDSADRSTITVVFKNAELYQLQPLLVKMCASMEESTSDTKKSDFSSVLQENFSNKLLVVSPAHPGITNLGRGAYGFNTTFVPVLRRLVGELRDAFSRDGMSYLPVRDFVAMLFKIDFEKVFDNVTPSTTAAREFDGV